MCGRPPVGKGFFDDNATLVGTAMCPACLRDADPWPLAIMCSANQVAVRSTQSLCGTGYHGLSWSPDRPARCIVPSCGDRYPLRRLSKSFGKGIFRSDSTSPHPHPATHIVRSRGWPGGGVGRCRFHVIGKCSRRGSRSDAAHRKRTATQPRKSWTSALWVASPALRTSSRTLADALHRPRVHFYPENRRGDFNGYLSPQLGIILLLPFPSE